jgi:hypothetical protein
MTGRRQRGWAAPVLCNLPVGVWRPAGHMSMDACAVAELLHGERL